MSTVDVRESMRRVPGFLQPLLTWITGKPLVGQEPLFRSSSLTQSASALVSLYGGALAGAWMVTQAGRPFWLLLPVAWMFVAGAARKIQVTLVHQCSHFNFTGIRKWDCIAAQSFSTLVLVDHFDSYLHEHIRIHHTKHLSSAEDPDCRFLLQLGFRPGMSERQLWNRLYLTIVSPRFHWIFLRARLRANFVDATPARRIAAVIYHTSILALVAWTGAWTAYALAWVLPLTGVYHVAALLNFSSPHFWLKDQDSSMTARERMCHLTAGRFLGSAAPEAGLPLRTALAAWSSWSAKMLFVHLPSRICVLSGDLPVHDYHHRYPRCGDWANFLYTRQRDIERGTPGWNIAYEENWGLVNAIGAVYASLSRTPEGSLGSGTDAAQGETLMLVNQI